MNTAVNTTNTNRNVKQTQEITSPSQSEALKLKLIKQTETYSLYQVIFFQGIVLCGVVGVMVS